MLTASVIEVIRGCGILPISRGVEPAMVLRSAAVLAAEGISVIEVTLDSPDPYDTITALRRQDGRLAVGAGTVRSGAMAGRAADAGAQFLVSPGFQREVLEAAAERGLPMIAGAMTPTEIVQAHAQGSAMVNVFPAGPLEQAPQLDVHVAGAESNVAIALCRLGTTAGWISRLVDTPLGRRIVNELRGHGVDVSRVLWAPDGRIGIYFLEQGIPPRQHRIIYDRAQSAMALLDPKEVDWGFVRSARLVHLTGITPALSAGCRAATVQAIAEARGARALVCFDVNYRAKLWSADEAKTALGSLLAGVDILISTADDARLLLSHGESAEQLAEQLALRFSAGTVVVTDAGRCAAAQNGQVVSKEGYEVESVDRVGAGDAFAAGFIHGYLTGGLDRALEYAVAVGAIEHTDRGDVAWVSKEDLKEFLSGSPRWR